ncbi:acyl-CoA/acyl-ACP dehydrogenase [Glycomyces luteolus]|uniref:Acyl-CoA/acyl-ACP dehydrogenase n=2 Tax=Glycomyces luteolus TaxID=2670330 RepID=A0A9X3PC90_9ACTN|nr:acyl-CoA dehydrogenase family protein [Glycomyces luteolus]MDA1362721.1 acyl-CoA/acyl-ACP dehydrogenase [Glycomyces luteolus]
MGLDRQAVFGIADQIRDRARETDLNGRFPVENLELLRRSGFMGALVGKAYGGLGWSLGDFSWAARTIGAACMSTGLIWAMHCQQADTIARLGEPRLIEHLLPRIARGQVYIASVTTEPGTGARLQSAQAALIEKDDGYKFERHAPVVTGGMNADGFLLTLRSHPEAGPGEVRLVYADRDQLSIEPRAQWSTLGMRGTASGGLYIEGAVDQSAVIAGDRDFGEIAAETIIPVAHVAWAACWLGAASGAFAQLVAWLRDPGRRGGPDVSSDLTRYQLAQIRARLEAVGGYLKLAVDKVESARCEDIATLRDAPARIHFNTLKLLASELTFDAVNHMVEVAGMAVGYTEDSQVPLARSLRDLRSASLTHANNRLWSDTGGLALMDRKVTLL